MSSLTNFINKCFETEILLNDQRCPVLDSKLIPFYKHLQNLNADYPSDGECLEGVFKDYKDIIIYDVEINESIFEIGFLSGRGIEAYYLNEDNFVLHDFFESISKFFSNDFLLVGYNNYLYDNYMIEKLYELKDFNEGFSKFISELYEYNLSLINGDFKLAKMRLTKDSATCFCLDLFKIQNHKTALARMTCRMSLPLVYHVNRNSKVATDLVLYNSVDLISTYALLLCYYKNIVSECSVRLSKSDWCRTLSTIGFNHISNKVGMGVFSWCTDSNRGVFDLSLIYKLINEKGFVFKNKLIKKFVDNLLTTRIEVYDDGSEYLVNSNKKTFHHELDLGGLTLVVKLGGLNSKFWKGAFFTKGDFFNVDVSSYYPCIIRFLFPLLKVANSKVKDFFEYYNVLLKKRLESKSKTEKDTLKYLLNPVFGLLGYHGTNFYNPYFMNLITMCGVVIMLMCLDVILRSGVDVVICFNTDGFIVKSKKKKSFCKSMSEFFDLFGLKITSELYDYLCFENSKNYFLYNSKSGSSSSIGFFRNCESTRNLYSLKTNTQPFFIFKTLVNYIKTKEFVLSKDPSDYIMPFYDGIGLSLDGAVVKPIDKYASGYISTKGDILLNGKKTRCVVYKDSFVTLSPDKGNPIHIDYYTDLISKRFPGFDPDLDLKGTYIPGTVQEARVRDDLLRLFPDSIQYKNFFVPGSGGKKLLKGVKLDSPHEYCWSIDKIKTVHLLTGRMTQLVCVDVDDPKEFSNNKILFNIISKQVDSTLVSYKNSVVILKKDELLKNRFKIFFKTDITDDYVYSRNKFSGCEILWQKSAPAIYGYCELQQSYRLFKRKKFHIKRLPRSLTKYLIRNGHIHKLNFPKEIRRTQGSALYNQDYLWEELRTEFGKRGLLKHCYTNKSHMVKTKCPFYMMHTEQKDNYSCTLELKEEGDWSFLCSHKTCKHEVSKLYYEIKESIDNKDFSELFRGEDDKEISNLTIDRRPVGSGKTYELTKRVYDYLKGDERFIYTTNSKNNVDQVFDYLCIHAENDKNENALTPETIRKKLTLIDVRAKNKDIQNNFIITYSLYLGLKGDSTQHFKLLKNVMKQAARNQPYHLIIDEAQLFFNNTLYKTYPITTSYRQIKTEDEYRKIKNTNVSLQELTSGKGTIDKVIYIKKYISNGYIHIYESLPVAVNQERWDDVIRIDEDEIDEENVYKLHSIGYKITFLDKEYKAADKTEICKAIMNNPKGTNINEVLEYKLRWSITAAVTELQPTDNEGKLIEYKELENKENYDDIKQTYKTPYTRDLSMFYILPLLVMKNFCKSVTLTSATFHQTEVDLLKTIWQNKVEELKENKNEITENYIKDIIFVGLNDTINVRELVELTKNNKIGILKYYNSKDKCLRNYESYKSRLMAREDKKYLSCYWQNDYYGNIEEKSSTLDKSEYRLILSYLRSGIATGINIGKYDVVCIDITGILPITILPQFNYKGMSPNKLSDVICTHLANYMVAAITQAMGRIMREGGRTSKLVILEHRGTQLDAIIMQNLVNKIRIKNKGSFLADYSDKNITKNSLYAIIEHHIKELDIKNEKRSIYKNIQETRVHKEKKEEENKLHRLVRKINLYIDDPNFRAKTRLYHKRYDDIREEAIEKLPYDVKEKVDIITKTKRRKKKLNPNINTS